MHVKASRALLAALVVVAVGCGGGAGGALLGVGAGARRSTRSPGNSTELNTAAMDGCPIQSPDGLSLYLASNRPGGVGLLDIWVAHRPTRHAPWGAPENLGEPVNSAADDFCPTPIRRRRPVLRQPRGAARQLRAGRHLLHPVHAKHGWSEPQHLALRARRAEQPARRAGPVVRQGRRGTASLYFSSSSRDGPGRHLRQPGRRRLGLRPGRAGRGAQRRGGERHPAERARRTAGRSCSRRTGRARWAPRTSGSRRGGASTTRGARPSTWAERSTRRRPRRARRSRETRGRCSSGARRGPEGMSDVYMATRRAGDGD